MSMAVEADWSELPKELLNWISKLIDTEIDLIRFRSICSKWRFSSIPNHHRNILTIQYPLLKFPLDIDSINSNTPFCNLSKHSFFLIKPPPQILIRTPWIIKITQNSTGKTQHYHPLLGHFSPFPSPVFDFNNLSLIHLVTNFIHRHDNTDDVPYGYMNPGKVVAVTCHGKNPIVVGTFNCTGQPVVFKCGDDNWKVIPNMSAYLGDIYVFKGRPYVVDKTGWTVTVEPDNSAIQLVAESLVGGGDIKFLVESDGNLLLADVYDRLYNDFSLNSDHEHEHVRIDVFKLNKKDMEWVKLANLGDRVLFLGSLCSFSVSASDLCLAKGNCVIIIDNIFTRVYCESSFLDLDDGRLLPLTDYPEYRKLFWPPPKWIENLNA